MAEKVLGFKISEEMHDKVKAMIEHTAGGSNKEWLEKAVALSEINELKTGAPDYKQDLSELEVHTTRIYELVANMIQRANYLKDDAVKGLESKLESRELTISELQSVSKELKEQLKQLEDKSKEHQEEKQIFVEQVEGLRSTNENNQALIQEYKEKIDTLSSLVNEYKGYATENTELKQTFATEKEQMKIDFEEKEKRLVSSVEELKATAQERGAVIEQQQAKMNDAAEYHKKELENNRVNHVNELTQLTERKDLEKDRAVLEIERQYQAKLEEAHEQYNNKLAALFDKLDRKEKGKKAE